MGASCAVGAENENVFFGSGINTACCTSAMCDERIQNGLRGHGGQRNHPRRPVAAAAAKSMEYTIIVSVIII